MTLKPALAALLLGAAFAGASLAQVPVTPAADHAVLLRNGRLTPITPGPGTLRDRYRALSGPPAATREPAAVRSAETA